MNWRGRWMLGMMLVLAACTGAPTTEPDRVATRVAEDLAVSTTLTAVARQAQPTTLATSTSPATAAPLSPTSMAVPPTSTTVPPTAQPPTETPLLPTATPTLPPPTQRPPTLAPTPSDPTVPGFGSTNGLIGEIVLPGYSGPGDPIVFEDRIVFRLKVFDPDVGNADGANIQRVDMSIDDPNGNTVNVQPEQNSWYCSFGGGAPECNVWRFSQHNNQWPGGAPVCAGQGYQANMIVTTINGSKTDASWRFNFAIAGNYPPCN